MDTKESLNRLSMLHDMLMRHDEIFPQKAFDIRFWEIQGKKGLLSNFLNNRKDCGTAACALGSAMSYAPFQKMGLGKTGDRYFERNGLACIASPHYKGEDGFEAGAEFFGISYEESQYLFDPHQYGEAGDFVGAVNSIAKTTPQDVAERVCKIVKRKAEELVKSETDAA